MKFRFTDPEVHEQEVRVKAARQVIVRWAATQVDLGEEGMDEARKGAAEEAAAEARKRADAVDPAVREEVLKGFVENWEREYVSHRTQKALKVEGVVPPDEIDHDRAMIVLEKTLDLAGAELDALAEARPTTEETT